MPNWLIWTHGGGAGGESIPRCYRMRRLIERVEASDADPVICFAMGTGAAAVTVVWLAIDIALGAHFELDTAPAPIDDEAGRSIRRWTARLE